MEEEFIDRLRSIEIYDKYVNYISKKPGFKNVQIFYPSYCWALMNLYCISNSKEYSINKTALLIYKDELKSLYNSLNCKFPQISKTEGSSGKEKIVPITKVDNERDAFYDSLKLNENEKALRLKFRQFLKDRALPVGHELKAMKIELSVVDFLLAEKLLNLNKLRTNTVEYCNFAR
ncbi:MAG: hypothetical protein PHR96_03300 [Clostridia bacterium]|nr:hypothetical protein [Clostridia bacterium]